MASPASTSSFARTSWSGVQNVIERPAVLVEGETFVIDPSWLTNKRSRGSNGSARPVTTLANSEKELIEAALAESEGRISGPRGAAAKLGIPRQTLEWKIGALKIDKLAFRKR